MSRTPEQIAADDALTAAIEQVLRSYCDDGVAWLSSQYVVIVAQHRYDDEGEALTGVGVLYRDGDVPTHRAMGLVEYARTRMRNLLDDECG